MPVDPTRSSSSRRPQRKISEEEAKEIELKRIKGELSCAECRRLKLRCDKKEFFRRVKGLGKSQDQRNAQEPDDSFRFILADTDQLHKKIADMSHRIRQLEDALAILQSTVSDQRHPLLDDDLLKLKFGPEATRSQHQHLAPAPTVEQNLAHSIDALGTLTLGDSGDVKYFGRSAGSEADEESDDEDTEEDPPSALMNMEIKNFTKHFPFSKPKPSLCATIAFLESLLPTEDRALALGDSYIKHAANFFRPIKRDELFDSFMPGIYKAAAARRSGSEGPGSPETAKAGPGSSGITKNSPHALATLFFLFALGALLDLGLPPYNTEALHYYELGRAALDLREIHDSPQLDTVQALGLMATYHFTCSSYERKRREK
ncbi:hypothetical protein H0H93_016270 [Arthromyces matolae]|nr:hypothetical protein H0H93_016270 [Arthromyces matolae]